MIFPDSARKIRQVSAERYLFATMVVLRKVYFDHVAKGRVVQDGSVQSRVVHGRVAKDGVIFNERIIMGQIVQKRVVQNPVVQGLMVKGRYSKAFTQGRVAEDLLVET